MSKRVIDSKACRENINAARVAAFNAWMNILANTTNDAEVRLKAAESLKVWADKEEELLDTLS